MLDGDIHFQERDKNNKLYKKLRENISASKDYDGVLNLIQHSIKIYIIIIIYILYF